MSIFSNGEMSEYLNVFRVFYFRKSLQGNVNLVAYAIDINP